MIGVGRGSLRAKKNHGPLDVETVRHQKPITSALASTTQSSNSSASGSVASGICLTRCF